MAPYRGTPRSPNGMKVLSIQPTPNPLAFKFVVDETLQAEGSRYYNTATEAAAPLPPAMVSPAPRSHTLISSSSSFLETNSTFTPLGNAG